MVTRMSGEKSWGKKKELPKHRGQPPPQTISGGKKENGGEKKKKGDVGQGFIQFSSTSTISIIKGEIWGGGEGEGIPLVDASFPKRRKRGGKREGGRGENDPFSHTYK